MRASALLLAAVFGGVSLAQLNSSTTPSLNLTAIGALNGESTLECWQLGPFASSSTPGVSGALNLFLGDASNASYTVIPGRFDGGLHNAPALQYVFFASGLIHLSLPNGTNEAWIQGGKYGLIIAADTANVSAHGHRTRYPSDADSVAIQVPLAPGGEFDYVLLHDGACTAEEMSGL
ncbi:hypothetical protein NKR23_g5993 [Pleurostoma richardsiae]|uniref:Small secreted protein n=1 Tax=Pleurostoma richardsiae TaxID=41990 RepID=A0AA38REM0_9PEZI|nr:hypothetical protein NKR23_g5993 [Pleurostoma richardsiae]